MKVATAATALMVLVLSRGRSIINMAPRTGAKSVIDKIGQLLNTPTPLYQQRKAGKHDQPYDDDDSNQHISCISLHLTRFRVAQHFAGSAGQSG